jgi:hypothetical protein
MHPVETDAQREPTFRGYHLRRILLFQHPSSKVAIDSQNITQIEMPALVRRLHKMRYKTHDLHIRRTFSCPEASTHGSLGRARHRKSRQQSDRHPHRPDGTPLEPALLEHAQARDDRLQITRAWSRVHQGRHRAQV